MRFEDGGIYVDPTDRRSQWLVAEQAFDFELARPVGNGMLVSWDGIYVLLEQDPTVAHLFVLPIVDDGLVPSLTNAGTTLGDGFRVKVDGWADASGKIVSPATTRPVGPLVQLGTGRQVMLRPAAWDVIRAVGEFSAIRKDDSSPRTARQHWARIGRAARACAAPMSSYLRTTIVVTADHLDLRVAESVPGVMEVRPTFDDAPDGWINAYDRQSDVPETYRLASGGVDYEVVLDEDVRCLLQEVKRELPRRRVAGPRAQRLIRNPFAFFGDRSRVLRPDVVDEQLEAFERGATTFEFAADLHAPKPRAGVVVTAQTEDDVDRLVDLASPAAVRAFAGQLRRAVDEGVSVLRWRGHRLLVEPDEALRNAERAELVADRWSAILAAASEGDAASTSDSGNAADTLASSRPPSEPGPADADLGPISRRIEGFGVEQQYAIVRVPSRRDWPGWLPDELRPSEPIGNSQPDASDPDESVEVQFSPADLDAIRTAEAGHSVHLPDLDIKLSGEQRDAVARAVLGSDELDEEGPDSSGSEGGSAGDSIRVSLLAISNIETVDYVAQRANLTVPHDASAVRPSALRDDVQLKEHQIECLTWLQHLWSLGNAACNGALLADDMGLGKTLQALAFIVEARERLERDGEDVPPALVVAPVSLLANWHAEVGKFFEDGAVSVASVYGAHARKLRAEPHEVPAELSARGITSLLRPGWTQMSDIVLTTYDAVRDYEYSFATQPWSVVVVDEAQGIKNPNALRTRAVVKLNARFCLACTGTPVENSLTDLWSIFNFVQPSLLGSANEFGRRYRRVIEGDRQERTARLEELRQLIEPQKLRRMKRDVARDLPRKIDDSLCKSIPMRPAQAAAYRRIAGGYDERTGSQGMLQIIHALRLLCSDYSRYDDPLDREQQPLEEAREDSAKLDWLITQLDEIASKGEKALVFMESLSMQRRLKRFIDERYGLDVAIINGSTSTSEHSEFSRQRLIDAFSARERDGVFDLLILSPIAAGVGLNIQAANHVIHFMRHWNPAKEDQATDRAYRIGQQRDVTVYTPIVVGDGFASFDERLDELLAGRRELARDMLHGTTAVDEAELASIVHDAAAQTLA